MSTPRSCCPVRSRPLRAARLLAALAVVAVLGAGNPAFGEVADADFLAAKAAYERGDRARLAALAPQFSGSLLENYVSYWTLKLGLDTATRADVRRYWELWPDTPLTDRLRVEWLKLLGQRADWKSFALDYPPPSGEDVELSCYGIQYRRDRDGDGVLVEAKPLWFSGQSTPDACEPLFAALFRSRGLGAADRLARFRLAVDAGNFKLAQAVVAELPAAERMTARQFAAVDKDPARALAGGDFAWTNAGGRSLALYALERAARTDAAAVRGAWERQRGHLPEADRLYGNGRLAFHAARQLHASANDWYREAAGTPLTPVQREWQVRAALRAGAWRDVLAAVEAMPPDQAQESAWRYWRARALGAAGPSDEAAAVMVTLATEPSFYGVLAAESLGRPSLPGQAGFGAAGGANAGGGTAGVGAAGGGQTNAAAIAAFGTRAGAQRTVKLAALGMRQESLREWIHTIRGLDDDKLLVAAEFARSQKLYDRAINTAERATTRPDFGLRYLTPYREPFARAARETGLEEALLFGIARQESRFSADIVSSAGAVGLMQLMPGTARWVAKQLGRGDYRPSDITDLGINTQFGAYYFRYWLDRLEGRPALATAAYNAGPGRAQAWRVGVPLEGAVWVETIPFNETRDYVKKVLANVMFYTRELNQPYVALTARLGTIPARGEGNGKLASSNVVD